MSGTASLRDLLRASAAFWSSSGEMLGRPEEERGGVPYLAQVSSCGTGAVPCAGLKNGIRLVKVSFLSALAWGSALIASSSEHQLGLFIHLMASRVMRRQGSRFVCGVGESRLSEVQGLEQTPTSQPTEKIHISDTVVSWEKLVSRSRGICSCCTGSDIVGAPH